MNFLRILGFLLLIQLVVACGNDEAKLKETGNCVNCDLTKAYLKGMDLSGADLSGSKILEANLQGANLSGANLSNTFLFASDLLNSNLEGANFTGADLSAATIRNSKTTGMILKNTIMESTIWVDGIKCKRGSIDVCYKTNMERLEKTRNCQGCSMLQKDLSGRDLSGVIFDYAYLNRTNFKNANLKGASFMRANLSGANLEGANLEGARFEGAFWIDGEECQDGSFGKCVKTRKD